MPSKSSEDRNRLEDKLFEFALFLLISARGCRDEPCIYGSFRLMDAISRICDIYAKSNRLEPDSFLAEIKKQVDRDKYKSIQSEDAFIQSMDDLVAKFTDELKVRYASSKE
jgi:Family of unknown function (DUF6092)